MTETLQKLPKWQNFTKSGHTVNEKHISLGGYATVIGQCKIYDVLHLKIDLYLSLSFAC